MTEYKKFNLFQTLISMGCLMPSEIRYTKDGFSFAVVSLETVLSRRGIHALPDAQGDRMECRLFFDDWFLYSVSGGSDISHGMLKMREQEFDRKHGKHGDGDTPGITVSFVPFCVERLLDCLADDSEKCRRDLCIEIDRVVSQKGQHHDPVLKHYFSRVEAEAPYLIAHSYAHHIASFAEKGKLLLPEIYQKRYAAGSKKNRIARFLEENNAAANHLVCDHKMLYFADISQLTKEEMLAVLATHTANTSFHSFAAEIRFHALFLRDWLRYIPFAGKRLYESAVRADMTIDNSAMAEFAPYYHAGSRMVKAQFRLHREYD